MLRDDKPLWLPAGSVRSVIALALVGAYIADLVTDEIVYAVIGFYFGQRLTEEARPSGPE